MSMHTDSSLGLVCIKCFIIGMITQDQLFQDHALELHSNVVHINSFHRTMLHTIKHI